MLIRASKDFMKYREYLIHNVKYSLSASVSNTILGFLWWIIDPIINALIYTVVFRFVFRIEDNDFPVFVLCALLAWKWMVSTINYSANCIKANSGIISQVYLPKYLLPLQECIAQFIRFLISIGVLIIFILLYGVPLSFHCFEAVFVIVSHFLFIFFLSLIITHFAVLVKDLKNVVVHVTRIWWYLSPGIYSLSRIPDEYHWLFWLNPNTAYFESYRSVFIYAEAPSYLLLGIWALISVAGILVGIRLLYKYDGSYSKML